MCELKAGAKHLQLIARSGEQVVGVLCVLDDVQRTPFVVVAGNVEADLRAADDLRVQARAETLQQRLAEAQRGVGRCMPD